MENIREAVSRAYLGKFGIHGVGIKDNKIVIYGSGELGRGVIKLLRRDARPFEIVVVVEEPPRLA